jgi:hypothetical protein
MAFLFLLLVLFVLHLLLRTLNDLGQREHVSFGSSSLLCLAPSPLSLESPCIATGPEIRLVTYDLRMHFHLLSKSSPLMVTWCICGISDHNHQLLKTRCRPSRLSDAASSYSMLMGERKEEDQYMCCREKVTAHLSFLTSHPLHLASLLNLEITTGFRVHKNASFSSSDLLRQLTSSFCVQRTVNLVISFIRHLKVALQKM